MKFTSILVFHLLASITIIPSALAQPGKVLWTRRSAAASFGPVSLGPNGSIYVGDQANIIALDTRGNEKWRYASSTGELWRPIVVALDGTLYVVRNRQHLLVLNPDGTAKCTFSVDINSQIYFPTVDSAGVVYVPVNVSNGESYFLALNPNMTKRWRYDLPAPVRFVNYAGSAIGPDGTIYFMANPGGLIALNQDGSLKWKNSSMIYCCPPGDSVQAPAIGPDGSIRVRQTGYANNGTNLWGTAQPSFFTPVISSTGTTYVDVSGIFTAISSTGTVLWEFRLPAGAGLTTTAATAADGTVYVCASDLNLYAIGPDGKERWHFTASTFPNTDLVIGPDGTVYTTSQDGTLYAIQGSAGPDDNSWSMSQRDARHSGNLPSQSPPIIVSQPTSQSAPQGSDVTLSVSAAGFPTPRYQWKYGGTDILGANYSSFTITNIQPFYAGDYTVSISNSLGAINSQAATLTVKSPSTPIVYVNGIQENKSSVRFSGGLTIRLTNSALNSTVYYTLDGTLPNRTSRPYQSDFSVTETAILRAVTFIGNSVIGAESDPIRLELVPAYGLNLIASAGGQVANSCGGYSPGPFMSNDVVTAAAEAGTGWNFLKWVGETQGTNSTLAVTMDHAKTIIPVFGTGIGFTNFGGGSVTASSQLSLFPEGSIVRLSAVPAPGNYFVSWTNIIAGNQNPLPVSVTISGISLGAVFSSLPTNRLTLVMTSTGGGDVALDRLPNLPLLFNAGDTVTVHALPDKYQRFIGWTGDVTGTANPLQIRLDRTLRINAVFSDDPVIDIHPMFTGRNDSNFWFTARSQSNGDFAVDHSEDLIHWTNHGSITIVNGIAGFSDSLTNSASHGFYRLRH